MTWKKFLLGLKKSQKVGSLVVIILCLSAVIIAGCSLTKQASLVEPENGKLKICTSFYPIYIMALNLVQDVPGVELLSIAPPDTGCLHDVHLSPVDLKTLAESDIFIINGSGMEEYLEEVLTELPNLKVIDSTAGLNLTNPHAWVSVGLNIQQVRTIGEQLAELDPANKEKYLENMANYIAKLEELKDRMQHSLASLTNRKIVTFHQAFPYLAEELDLEILAVVQPEAGSEPSAKELAEIIKLVRDHQVKAIFIEPQYPDGTAQVIARETGAKVYTLDPAATGPLTADAYLQIMEKNLLTLQEALKE
ncbi:MAG TPA: zinc ABC transporter solute-binding protein [Peptococcaceae bacterium]|nr:zinc ABC transporter solute-binding protein [Peptococcaceae bacterium]